MTGSLQQRGPWSWPLEKGESCGCFKELVPSREFSTRLECFISVLSDLAAMNLFEPLDGGWNE